MKQTIHFTKMHGAGNDYIYVNTLLYTIPDPSAASIQWSKPHFGIGSDGLILIGAPTRPDADFSMRIFNNDGSEAMMCGNGTRCVAKYLHDKGLTDKNPIRLQTLAGIKVLQLHLDADDRVETVTVDMGEPVLRDPKQFTQSNDGAADVEVTADGRTFRGTFVSMGNPHFVIFLDDEDVETFPLDHYGPLLEHHPAFPQRCNIEFAQAINENTFRMRVWERGSGITLACGTGACATAVAAHLTGRAGRESDIRMDGGTLHIHWNETDNHVLMTGPAAITFEGEVTLP
ncbi:MAG: diaminopimelate epimerase [Bacteroidaceae bacterium]|nr:diaminopimelate epimerase [Bacteroidaceae bacterium]